MLKLRWKATVLFASFCLAVTQIFATGPAVAQGRGIAIVRDAEIEHILRTYATPIFGAAGLDPASVKIHLINDPTLNAFVALGQNLFFHTGLLIRAESASQVIGVIAHETGHLAGGHIARTEEAIRAAYVESLIATVLGAAAIAAGAVTGGGGATNAGAGVLAAGQQVAQRNFLAFTRTQESAADQAAVSFLDSVGESSRGLTEFLRILGTQESQLIGRTDPYVRSHPVSRERVDALRVRVEQSPYANRNSPPEYAEMHARTQAKLIGFLEPLATTLRRYPKTDESLPARYARAIGYYRATSLAQALLEIDRLIAERPNDPYFHELKGQVLFENGRIEDSIEPYQNAVRFAPHEPLFLTALGQSMIATEDRQQMVRAINILEESVRVDNEQPIAWFQLSIAYGRTGRIGDANLASAERALLIGQLRDARNQAERAKGKLNPGSPASLRADDIIDTANRRLRQQNR